MANANRRKWLRRLGLILGLIWAGWFTFLFLVLFGIGIQGDFPYLLVLLGDWRSWWLVAVPGVISFGSVVIAWKWERIGGAILVILGLVLICSLVVFSIKLILLAAGFPLLVSGVLFILSWREGRKKDEK